MMDFSVSNILLINDKFKEKGKLFSKKRYLYRDIVKYSIKGRDRITGIIGQRGVGKTVLLSQLLNEFGGLYLSLDMFDIKGVKSDHIIEIVTDILKKENTNYLFLDEIHYYNNYDSLLKLFYDITDIKIIFTSSVSILMAQLNRDLSRRMSLRYLYPFDYKEFLYFTKDIDIPYLTWENIINNEISLDYLKWQKYFHEYLQGGIYPFYNETENFIGRLNSILERIIKDDIPKLVDITINDIANMEDMLKFMGKSEIDGISFSSLSKNINVSIYKIKQYVEALERSFVLNVVYPVGSNVKKEPKILFTPPVRLMYRKFDECICGLREDFAVQMMKQKGFETYYLKSKKGEKRPDYLIVWEDDRIIVEIGGKGKGYSQFKGIKNKYKKLIFKDNCSRINGQFPLYMLGMISREV